MKDLRIIEYSVVQVNENGPEGWIGCLMQVDEVKSFGVQAGVKMPKGGTAYLRLNWEQIDYIGQAVMVSQEQTD
jgi:hypothetical protein